MIVKTIPAEVHGRYCWIDRGADRLIAGFHGFGETAEHHLEQLERIPETGEWSIVSIQALHPFYTRSGQVVASWMTRLDRELAVDDNVAYVRHVLRLLPQVKTLVLSGFSQGAAMASRAAAFSVLADGLILLGGDIPPEVKEGGIFRLPHALVGRGTLDEWYTAEKLKSDLSFLESESGATVVEFEGGHEWTDVFREAAGDYLRTLRLERHGRNK